MKTYTTPALTGLLGVALVVAGILAGTSDALFGGTLLGAGIVGASVMLAAEVAYHRAQVRNRVRTTLQGIR